MPCLSQTSAISFNGSNAPTTVVPEVATTAMGCLPCRESEHNEMSVWKMAGASADEREEKGGGGGGGVVGKQWNRVFVEERKKRGKARRESLR